MGAIRTLKFSESGVRGVVGESLTVKLVTELAAAFGCYIGGGRVVVGRDTRPSGEMFEQAVCCGLSAVGCEVIKLGIVPTPTMQLMTRELACAGGVVVTASHNPYEWNALKFISQAGMFLDQTEAAELFDVYTQSGFEYVEEERIGGTSVLKNAFEIHRRKIFDNVDTGLIRRRHFKVAVDCVNGVGALYSPDFLRQLGCEVVVVNGTPDGIFGRGAEPRPEHLQEIAEVVKREKCDLGFAQDPDGDRLTLIDDSGNILSPHLTVALAIEHVISRRPGNVVVNIQTSRIVEELAEDYESRIFYSRVGEINVVEKMLQVGAEIGGEGNCGGVIYRPVNLGRDSFTAMALLLESLAASGDKLTSHLRSMVLLWQYNGRFEAGPAEAREVISALKSAYAGEKITDFDGLRIDFAFGWALVRASNTESILRLQIESEAEDALEMLKKELTEKISSSLRKYQGKWK